MARGSICRSPATNGKLVSPALFTDLSDFTGRIRARLPEVWGENPDVWNPDRFFNIEPGKQTNVGVFANL